MFVAFIIHRVVLFLWLIN